MRSIRWLPYCHQEMTISCSNLNGQFFVLNIFSVCATFSSLFGRICTKIIDFQFTKGTNMDVNLDPHAHHSFFKIIDEDTYESRTENWGGGKATSYRYTVMQRVK